jgi:octaprenyl-diphosphate synthase
MKTILKPQEIYGLVSPDLERVEAELGSYARSSIEPVARIARHLLEAGGKRVRPALLLLTARMVGGVSPASIRLGAVVELIHNATLVHDDVIDASDTRRGRRTANARWGNPMTVLAGDWLYMQSFAVALGERNFEVLGTLIEITQKMVEGELIQLTLIGQSDVTEAQLLDIADRKTASLFSGCMRLPAIVAGRPADEIETCAAIGRSLGMAFQLVDDLLDLTSTREVLGKPAASDLREGKVTLPVCYALADGSPEARDRIERVLEDPAMDPVPASEIVDAVRSADGVDRTRQVAARYAARALDLLETLPASTSRDAIASIPDFILNRPA